MQVNICGTYRDRLGLYHLPELCNFVQTATDAVKWAIDEVDYLERRHGFKILSCAVYSYNPNTGDELLIKQII